MQSTNISKALSGLREERREAQNQVQKLGETISVLEKLTGASQREHTGVKRVISAEGLRRISLAQTKRWAKVRRMKKAA